MDISEILINRLGTHIEYYWDGIKASRETVLNDGDIKLTGDAYISRRRVYTNKHLTEMKTTWVYRPHGDYVDPVNVAQKLAHQMIMESERKQGDENMRPKPENRHQAANRHHARQTNTQRVRFVRTTIFIDGSQRHILTPTTSRDIMRVLPDNSPYITGRR